MEFRVHFQEIDKNVLCDRFKAFLETVSIWNKTLHATVRYVYKQIVRY